MKENQDAHKFKTILNISMLALSWKYRVRFLRIFLLFGRKGNAFAEMQHEVRGAIQRQNQYEEG
jgi:hypothetical protein